MSAPSPLGWGGIARLGLVQACLGAVVVLSTATLNRVMVVELALPATVPGALVGLHYGVQLLRPRWGHGSDASGRRTPWIVGGLALLALGGFGAAAGTALAAGAPLAGIALAALAFLAIGVGVGAAGTSLLVLAATRVEERRRPASAAIIWITMIAGFAITAGVAGHFLDPFSMTRLLVVAAVVCAAAFLVGTAALWRLEGPVGIRPVPTSRQPGFVAALREVWAEPDARRFTVFVFVSMLAYSAQDLVLEPFAGIVLGLSPGETTQLSALQHGGVLAGMVAVALAATVAGRRRAAVMRAAVAGGCALSAAILGGLALLGVAPDAFPLRPAVLALGVANGVFAVAAIGSMMILGGRGARSREGVRMGLWGAAQALAFGLGSLAGTVAVDVARALLDAPAPAYASVFAAEAILFILAARLAPAAVEAAGLRPGERHLATAGA